MLSPHPISTFLRVTLPSRLYLFLAHSPPCISFLREMLNVSFSRSVLATRIKEMAGNTFCVGTINLLGVDLIMSKLYRSYSFIPWHSNRPYESLYLLSSCFLCASQPLTCSINTISIPCAGHGPSPSVAQFMAIIISTSTSRRSAGMRACSSGHEPTFLLRTAYYGTDIVRNQPFAKRHLKFYKRGLRPRSRPGYTATRGSLMCHYRLYPYHQQLRSALEAKAVTVTAVCCRKMTICATCWATWKP